MSQVKVNLTLEQDIWEEFGKLVPNRKKSRIINELIKQNDSFNQRNESELPEDHFGSHLIKD